MKNIFTIISFFVLNISIFAFNPPVDILEMNYNSFSSDYEQQIILKDGYFTVNKQVEYYGITISYSISFKKNEEENYYIFFERPYDRTDQFNEFFSDVLLWYAKKSDFVVFSDDFSLSESEPKFNFFINENLPITIYRKESMDTGFRGFGITIKKNEKYIKGEYPISNYCDPFTSSLLDLESFNPEKIKESTIFIKKDFIKKEIDTFLTEEKFNDDYFFEEYFMKANTKYKVNISNWVNEEGLKDYRIITSNNNTTSFFEIIKNDEYFIYSNNEPLLLLIVGLISENIEFGPRIIIIEN